MIQHNTYNTIDFKGRLLTGRNLSKTFDKSVPILEEMIKDKPYDVYVHANGLYQKKGRTHRTTNFEVRNGTYINKYYKHDNYKTSTKDNTQTSYIYTMQNVIDATDKKIDDAKKRYESRSLKEKIHDKCVLLKEMFINALYQI